MLPPLGAGCDAFVVPDGMDTDDDLTETSFGTEIYLTCHTGTYISNGIDSISEYCLDTGVWYPDIDTVNCSGEFV